MESITHQTFKVPVKHFKVFFVGLGIVMGSFEEITQGLVRQSPVVIRWLLSAAQRIFIWSNLLVVD